MTETSLVEALKATLEDMRLTRGERRAVRAMVRRQVRTRQQRDVLRAAAFDLARDEVRDGDALAVIQWLEEIVKAIEPPQEQRRERTAAYFAPQDACPHRLITLLNGCRKSADICVFTITDNRITAAIEQAHHRGARIRVISDDYKRDDLGSDIRQLEQRGVEVRVDPTPHHMHHKFAVIDEQTLVTGSYNWTRSASTGNFENLVLLSDDAMIAAFVREFERLWTLFQ